MDRLACYCYCTVLASFFFFLFFFFSSSFFFFSSFLFWYSAPSSGKPRASRLISDALLSLLSLLLLLVMLNGFNPGSSNLLCFMPVVGLK